MGKRMFSEVRINEKYKSSVRLDALGNKYSEFLDSLIIHGTLLGTLTSICSEVSGSAQRAFTVTGPYGSGKSTLAALLSGIVGTNSDYRAAALQKFDQHPELQLIVNTAFKHQKGWSVVKHVCGLTKPSQAIALSVCKQFNRKVSKKELSKFTDAECLELIGDTLNSANDQHDGVVILLDELGKALDFQSNNDGDLYFFQELADLAQRAEKTTVIVGFLHQAFSQYAKGKSALTQKEWAKIQGRYRDLSYNPTVDESLILIGDSISVSPAFASQLKTQFSDLINAVIAEYPKTFTTTQSLINTLPLDPIVSLLLGPISRRRFSQNERSIFGFLASQERYGFRWYLENRLSPESISLYSPELLWSYLDTNLNHLIASSPDGKPWLEAQDAIFRVEQKGDTLHYNMTILIALVSIFGQSYRLFATKNLIINYYLNLGYSKATVIQAIEDLENWSIVIFRQKHNALFIFQGSDLDVNNMIVSEIESIQEGVSWAKECTTPTYILASSHYHQFGAMRWATTTFVETAGSIESLKYPSSPKSGEPFTSFILIAESLSEAELKKISIEYPQLVLGSASNTHKLKSSAIEVVAIQNIFKRESQLAHDHIARQELNSRLSESKQGVSDELDDLFQNTAWFYKGLNLKTGPLSQLASRVADDIYPSSPKVLNELVNRSKPSGSANSATNKLMVTMLSNDSQSDLGFDENTFPPEKGIYLSVLKSKGWHRKSEIGWAFTSDWTEDLQAQFPDSYNLWNAGYKFIKDSASAVTLAELYDFWMKPPFGLTAGLCRIYALALLKSLEGQVAFYDKDSTQSFIFIPQLDEVIVEKLHKHSHEVAVRYFEIDSVQTNLVRGIATAVQRQQDDNSDLLSLAKQIVNKIHLLPSWVKKTSGNIFTDKSSNLHLSKEAKSLRNSALRANDPYKLILEDIPSIFEIDNQQPNNNGIDELTRKLADAINELGNQHYLLLDGFKTIILRELGADFDEALANRSASVSQSAHRPAIKEFASRLTDYVTTQDTASFERLISTALGATERNWTDKHIRNGLHEVYNLCRQFRREESFSRMSKAISSKTIGLITSDSKGNYMELEGHIANAGSAHPKLESTKEAVIQQLTDLPDDIKRETLVQILSELMHPVDSEKGNTHD